MDAGILKDLETLARGIEEHAAIKAKEAEERVRKQYEKVEEVNQIFRNHFKDNVEFIKDSEGQIIHILYPELTITNRDGDIHKIKNLLVRLRMYFNKSTGIWRFSPEMDGKRLTQTFLEKNANYTHSHLSSGASITAFGGFCLGSGAVAGLLALLSTEISNDNIELLCHTLDSYVIWEDLVGKPYKYMNRLYVTPFEDGGTGYNDVMRKGVIKLIKDKDLYKTISYNGRWWKYSIPDSELSKRLLEFSSLKLVTINGTLYSGMTIDSLNTIKSKYALGTVGTVKFNGRNIPLEITDVDQSVIDRVSTFKPDKCPQSYLINSLHYLNHLLQLVMAEDYIIKKQNTEQNEGTKE